MTREDFIKWCESKGLRRDGDMFFVTAKDGRAIRYVMSPRFVTREGAYEQGGVTRWERLHSGFFSAMFITSEGQLGGMRRA